MEFKMDEVIDGMRSEESRDVKIDMKIKGMIVGATITEGAHQALILDSDEAHLFNAPMFNFF